MAMTVYIYRKEEKRFGEMISIHTHNYTQEMGVIG